jgi:hypothetical protein
MKKSLLLFAVSLSSLAFSQITLNMGDIANIGFSIRQANDTLPTVTPGPSGASQTWNFTNLNNHYMDTLLFTNPNWTPYGGSFPGSNLCLMFGTSGFYAYLRNNSNSLEILGQAGDFGFGPMVIDLNPDELILPYPFTYNGTYNNTSKYSVQFPFPQPPMDSLRVKNTTIKSGNADAWGTVTTPLASNVQVLRIREQRISIDSVFAHITFPAPSWQFMQESRDTTIEYSYWAKNTGNNYGFPLVNISTDAQGQVTSANWLQAAPAQTGIEENELSSISTYPNPGVNEIFFDCSKGNFARITLVDATGKEVLAVPAGNKVVKVDVAHLDAGTYFYYASDREGSVRKAGKILITR